VNVDEFQARRNECRAREKKVRRENGHKIQICNISKSFCLVFNELTVHEQNWYGFK
jgi:hypothetical protein